MDEGHEDILQHARDGALAVANGDSGRSAFLLEQIATLMRSLTVAECEWLSVAVSNGAFNRLLNEPPKTDIAVDTVTTPAGEIWDI